MNEFKKDIMFWQGFDMAIDMIYNILDAHEKEALFTVHKFINELKEEIEEEVERYKNDD
jgi:hypothetical protein